MTCEKKGHNCEGGPDCPGWDWFNGMEICAVNECEVFVHPSTRNPGTLASDDHAAKMHIAECPDCQQKLGKAVIDMLIEYRCYGVWPVFGDVHDLPDIPHNPDAPGSYPSWWKPEEQR